MTVTVAVLVGTETGFVPVGVISGVETVGGVPTGGGGVLQAAKRVSADNNR